MSVVVCRVHCVVVCGLSSTRVLLGAGKDVVLLVGNTCVFAGAFVVKRCVGVNDVVFIAVSCLLEELVEVCLLSVCCPSLLFCALLVVGTVVPGFSLNHVSPVQACPCRPLFCCRLDKF